MYVWIFFLFLLLLLADFLHFCILLVFLCFSHLLFSLLLLFDHLLFLFVLLLILFSLLRFVLLEAFDADRRGILLLLIQLKDRIVQEAFDRPIARLRLTIAALKPAEFLLRMIDVFFRAGETRVAVGVGSVEVVDLED